MSIVYTHSVVVGSIIQVSAVISLAADTPSSASVAVASADVTVVVPPAVVTVKL